MAAEGEGSVLTRVPAWARVAAALFAIGYGANEFTPLMVLYREQAQLSPVVVAAVFGVYVAGLVPGVLLGGPASDRWGRRALLVPALLVSVPASGVLALGGLPGVAEPALFVGRFLFGAVTGVAMGVGSAWVKELSTAPHDPGADAGSGARRAALAISAGFGVGPLVAGLVARFAPLPLELPYLLHVLITVPLLLGLRGAPETRAPRPDAPLLPRLAVPVRFRRLVVPMAPWVFGAGSVSFAVQPAALGPATGDGLQLATVLTSLTLGAAVTVQPLARRLDRRSPLHTARVGLPVIVAGTLLAAAAVALGAPALAVVASLVLGTGYGMCLVAGLLEAQRAAAPDELATLTALYWALTYVGFLLPVLLAALTGLAGYPVLLVVVAAAQLCSLAAVTQAGRATEAAAR